MTPRRWRDYQTSSGRRPVRDFPQSQSDDDAAEVVAAMAEVRELGLQAAWKLRGDIWEVRAEGNRVIHRVLFAQEGRRSFILLGPGRLHQEDPAHPAGCDRAGRAVPRGLAIPSAIALLLYRSCYILAAWTHEGTETWAIS